MKVRRNRHTLLTRWIFVFSVLAMTGSLTPVRADTGIVRAVVTKGGFVVGVGGGTGTLLFHGRRYPLSIGGMSFGATIGASTNDLRGHAYNMRTASDIEGTYSAIGAGGALAAGWGAYDCRTQKGWFSS